MFRAFCLLLILVSGPSYSEIMDGAPTSMIPLEGIHDAVPKWEPLSRFGNAPTYTVLGKQYTLLTKVKNYKERGVASWYGTKFHKQKTSSGEPYDMYKMTAAHKTLPIPSYARVTNLNNGKQVIVKINDRGPFHTKRILDLSYAAASKLGITGTGTARIELEVVHPKGSENHRNASLVSKIENAKLYMQIGAFSMEKNAEQFAQKIATVVKPPVAIRRHAEGELPLYRVQIGPILENRMLAEIHRTLISGGFGNALAIVE